jgi:polysaccharide export outer membrane protein
MCKIIAKSLIFLAIVVFSSCANKPYQSLFEKRPVFYDTVSVAKISIGEYRIKPQDMLQIRNLQNIKYIVDEAPSTTSISSSGSAGSGQTYQVESDGSVALPVIGHVAVGGLTRPLAAKLIEELYRKNLLNNPIIELKITNLKVTILGEIALQGNYPLIKDKTTLVEIIGQAGGLTPRANENKIKIIRGEALSPQVIMLDLGDIQSINDPRAILQNGDIIYISQNKRAVRNDNLQNISAITQPALLLLNTALLILTFSRR